MSSFAGTIGAEESENGPRSNRQRNLSDGPDITETFTELVEHDHRFVHLRNVIAMTERDLQPGDVSLEVCA
ncbi:MAG: hypothetical protein DMF04_11960 [Verrucomicrobia bacterium]|nr:MAG: hypothetical protein DMF04_11960 [Verrucomicrobiota bacterium]